MNDDLPSKGAATHPTKQALRYPQGENRATWYTSAAEAYARTRPTYPEEVIKGVC